MQLAQLLKRFSITPQQLSTLLSKQVEVLNLRFVREVPPEWEALLTQALGVPTGTIPTLISAEEIKTADEVRAASVKATVEPVELATASDEVLLDVRRPKLQPRLSDFKGVSRGDATQAAPSNELGRQVKKTAGSPPLVSEIRVGQLVEIVEGRYGFICKPGSTARLHLPGAAAGQQLPAQHTWLLFADKPDVKNPNRQLIYWARPVTDNLELFRKVVAHADQPALTLLLQAKLEMPSLEIVATELLGQLLPVTDTDTLAAVHQLLGLLKQKAIVSDEQGAILDELLLRSDPAFAWQLWLRYRSPLAEQPGVAERLINLLAAAPTVVTNWWPQAQQTGVAGLYLAYLESRVPEELLSAWQQLKTALGTTQSEAYSELLERWLDSVSEVADTATYLLYQAIARTAYGDKESLEQALQARLTPAAAVDGWLAEIIGLSFPKMAALTRFEELPVADQDRVVEQLTDEELIPLLDRVTQAHGELTRQRASQQLRQRIVYQFSALGLDLESNRETIREVTWGSPGAWHSAKESEAVTSVLQTLTERLASQPYLLVGHNLLDFDRPILAEYGVTFSAEDLWDTLLVEMALSPELHTYALQTAHTAVADAELALRLFVNQVLRLLRVAETDWVTLRALFAPAVQAVLTELRRQRPTPWLKDEELRRERQTFLRPQPAISLLRQQVQHWVADNAAAAIVLAPREVWAEVLLRSPVQFWVDEATTLDYRKIAPAELLRLVAAHPTEQLLLQRFFDLCRQEGWPSLAANMAPALRARLRGLGVDLGQCLLPVPTAAGSGDRKGTWCLSVEQLRAEQVSLRGQANLALAVIESDLLTLDNKRELRQLGADELRSNAATSAEWMKFSGGQSFMGLSREQVRQLGADPSAGYDTFWLEKHQYGQYRLWASFAWEDLVQGLVGPEAQVTYLSGAARPYPAGQLRSVSPNVRRLQQQLGVVPLNPETIYRSRYWLLQAELLAGLVSRGNEAAPLVLLVQRPEEVAGLESYFGPNGLGFYIPNREAQLGRRLELLHQSHRPSRLLIATIKQAAAILEANYLGPLRVVLESFNLLENFYLAQGSALFEAARRSMGEQTEPGTAVESEEVAQEADVDSASTVEEEVDEASLGILERNLLFLLELQRPVVQRLRALLADNDSRSQLWLLDPRLTDFAGLARSWGFGREVVEVAWQQRIDYDAAALVADATLGGVRPDADFTLDLDEARKLLQQVFLRDTADPSKARVYEWRDNQVPCLNGILPAQTDLVVTLATGGGKSVLFQAPALYRSSYTNRLSVVVTPLRALMEDQVSKLWELGFYSSVEYINSDKQDELGQIYRRVAGGEIQLLFITPERFRSNAFSKAFWQRFDLDHGLEYAVFDEAHCISQWGHEFRPDYLHSAREVQRMRHDAQQAYGRRFPVLLFSATVTEKILAHFNQLFPEDETTR